MLCPRCAFEGELIDGGCAHCGYGRSRISSGPLHSIDRRIAVYNSIDVAVHVLAPGDVLRQGRYRLIKQLALPKNQQSQGTAWLASDTQMLRDLVVIRRVIPPKELATNAEQAVRTAALHLAILGQHPGFPGLIDVFGERGFYYVVFEHIEGKSLAELIQERGAPLAERSVTEYGQQLCELLQVLSSQQPPLVHGSINPETVIVSLHGKRVSLIHMPLFAPALLSETEAKTAVGYLAPEQVHGSTEWASDIYGLAATLHHALTGYDPNEHMTFFYPPIRSLNSAVSSGMEAILQRALRASVVQRYHQPAVMQQDLKSLAATRQSQNGREGIVDSPAFKSGAMLEWRRRKETFTPIMFWTVSIGLCLLLLSTLLLTTEHNSPARRTQSLDTTATIAAIQNATATFVAQQETADTNAELTPETQMYTKAGIGISDGHFIFDAYAPRTDVALKQQAIQALQASDMSTAADQWMQAISTDPTDGEARIYSENLVLLQHSLPYVTVVLGLGFDKLPEMLSTDRAYMQAAFLAQYEINEFGLLPDNLFLRILIANSGPDNANVATIAHFIVNDVVHDGNPDHIIAVVGWPTSLQTMQASPILATAHLPLVSPTASNEELSGINSYFFRINPSYKIQANALTAAIQQMHARTVLVMRDQSDPESASIADALVARLRELKVTVINRPEDDFTEMITTVGEYRNTIKEAIADNVNAIFLAGSDVDAIRLAHAVGVAFRNQPANPVLANLKILGGNMLALNMGLLLGQCRDRAGDACSNPADASLAGDYPQDMQRLSFISLGDSQEWKALHLSVVMLPPFFTDWIGIYQNSVVADKNAPSPDQDVMLTYDALQIIARAAQSIQGSLAGQPIHDALTSLGEGTTPVYQGVSGRILFDAQGNPVDKAIAVLYIQASGGANMIKLREITGTFQVN